MGEVSTLWTLEGDSSEAVASIDEIVGSLDGLDASIGSVADSAGSLDGLSETLGGVSGSGSSLDEIMSGLVTTMGAFASQVEAATGSLSGLSDSAGGASTSLDATSTSADTAATSLGALGGTADTTAASLQGIQKPQGLNQTENGSKQAAGALGMIALAGVAAGGALLYFGSQGADALTRVQALTGTSTAQMQQYSASIDQMAGEYGASVKDLSGGLYDIVSVGLSGAGAINTLRVAAEAAAAGGTDLHTVTSGLTSIMKDFGISGQNASQAMDILLTGVRDGKAPFLDFSNAVGLVGQTAKGAGFGIGEATAALATLTMTFPSARMAGQDLKHLMTQIGVNAEATGAAAKKMGLHFDQASFNSDTLQQKLQYLWQITGGNEAELIKLTGGVAGFAAAQALMANKGSDFTRILGDMKHSTGATQNAFQEWHSTVQASVDDVGGSLSAMAAQVVVAIGPTLVSLLHVAAGAFSGLATLITQHGSEAKAILAGLAVVVAGVLVGAVYAAATSFFTLDAAALPIIATVLGVAAGIGVLVAGVMLAYQHITPFRDAVNAVGGALTHLWNGGKTLQTVLHALGAAFAVVLRFVAPLGHELGAQLGPIMAQLHTTLVTSLIPAWHSLSAAFVTVEPILRIVGMVIGGILVVALGLLVGVLTGVIRGLGQLVQGAITFAGGFIQVISGVVQIVVGLFSGLVKITYDLLTGNWKQLGTDARQLWGNLVSGVEQIVSGLWAMLRGLFQAGVGTVIGILSGFVSGVVGFFTNLWDTLVGHSIVPDMITSIVSWFHSLPDKALSAVQALASNLTGFFTGMAGQALTWGQHLIQGLINGITSMAGAAGKAAASIAGNIAKSLHFSKPDEGPLRDSDQWMGHFGSMLEHDLLAQTSRVQAAASKVAGAIATGIHSGAGTPAVGVAGGGSLAALPAGLSSSLPSGGGLGGGAQTVLLSRLVQLMEQGGNRAAPLGSSAPSATLGSVTQNFGNLNFNGLSNITQLFNELTALAGLAQENGTRGATQGLALS